MLFHSFSFFGLFIITFVVYWTLRQHRLRSLTIVVASIIFYMSWSPWLILLLIFSTSVDFLLAIQIERFDHNDPIGRRYQRLIMIFSIIINLAILATFKYASFLGYEAALLTSLNTMLGWVHASAISGIVLPLGISFYTFEAISYIVEVYQGKTKAVRNPLDYMLYILFFPHLIAGPIVRPRHFLPQINQYKHLDWARVQYGAQLFMLGLLKKAVIADNIAMIIDPVYANPSAYGSAATWLAVVGYAAQIYCDFSGYSDMAVGVAHCFGFKLPFNFHMPYFSANVSEFWSRWHISLSTWLRDYLYIPMGGNRRGNIKTYRNLMITMLLGGLWHGAAWTFVAWGFYHGLILAIHRMWRNWIGDGPHHKPSTNPLIRVSCILITFISVCIGWVLFRAQSFPDAWTIFTHMFTPAQGQWIFADSWQMTLFLSLLISLLIGHLIGTFVDLKKLVARIPAPVMGLGLAAALGLAQLLMPADVKAFIYFQF